MNKAGDPSILLLITFLASETATPSFTNAAACFRFSGVIRFNVPSSSFFPQRSQLESVTIMFSMSSLTNFRFVICRDGSSSAIVAQVTIRTDPKIRTVTEIDCLIFTSGLLKGDCRKVTVEK
ncbi:MAG: hypothetical protein HOL01_26365 [Planctomycetaceae bacterium]|nr:hypothetical protein [Planctomycetaceae bacterium]